MIHAAAIASRNGLIDPFKYLIVAPSAGALA
jgi:hypothetical protein